MKISIPGKPIPQERHKHRKNKNGFVLVYDPTARPKATIKNQIIKTVREHYPDHKPFLITDVKFNFYMPIPKSLSVKLRKLAENEKLRQVVKPDVDNMIKLYLDCMKGVIFKDDNSVNIIGAHKIYSSNPRTEITATEGILDLSLEQSFDTEGEFLVCDKPHYETMDIPPYSECPYYSEIPIVAAMIADRERKENA